MYCLGFGLTVSGLGIDFGLGYKVLGLGRIGFRV